MQKYLRAERREVDEYAVPLRSLTICGRARRALQQLVVLKLRIDRRRSTFIFEEDGCGPDRNIWPMKDCRNPLQGIAKARSIGTAS